MIVLAPVHGFGAVDPNAARAVERGRSPSTRICPDVQAYQRDVEAFRREIRRSKRTELLFILGSAGTSISLTLLSQAGYRKLAAGLGITATFVGAIWAAARLMGEEEREVQRAAQQAALNGGF